MIKSIYCCKCENHTDARLTGGAEIYPHRPDLKKLYFFVCDKCGNFVGCHPNTKQPLGYIAHPELKRLRQKIHKVIDPIWQSGSITRRDLYRLISEKIGWGYHTAKIRSVEEGECVLCAQTFGYC